MSSVIDRAADLLFPYEGPQTRNIKFFCVGEDNVNAFDLAEQIVRAESQIREGSAVLMEKIDD
ncbi:hypothetical protein [Pelagibacterium halotolerans]|uniref:hypothetical protein n=1 Tax=Pelagibacterium halotolerans TaxID=531813 RepID=UPI0005A1663A|nr:hypothetical protein [Pelagibacterium halotolerans]QJR19291.1 hypothetical protein HKM20_13085 [Pelagibacterium halotolerans]SDZ96073.1 hypothetical protein SAMN05428936_101681 [Pelagibacterium halotolerans]